MMLARATDPALRIMLVDDHPIVRRDVRDILVDAFPASEIEEVGSGAEALSLVPRRDWDVVILDLTLPDASGLDVLTRLRVMREHLPVLVLSMHGYEQFARRAMAAGANGYLTKESADAELVTAVERVARGAQYFARTHGSAHRHERVVRPHERLSVREFQIMRMIGSGKTVSEIALELSLSVKTISTYRARALEKMEMRTNAELTRYVVRHGLAE